MLATDLTVGALVERDGDFLIVEERVAGEPVLTQPGGHIEHAESPEAAAARESLEEAGCEITASELLGVYLWIHPQTRQQFLRLMYVCDLVFEHSEPDLDDGVIAVHWMTADDLHRQALRHRTPIVGRAVQDYLTGTRAASDMLSGMQPVQRNVPAMLASASLV
ncbi:MAG: NUDIX domain-containing protein [Pseudomonadota bacterium]